MSGDFTVCVSAVVAEQYKEYGEDDEHPHRIYDSSIQFSADGLQSTFD